MLNGLTKGCASFFYGYKLTFVTSHNYASISILTTCNPFPMRDSANPATHVTNHESNDWHSSSDNIDLCLLL